jgi:hypothetical protein
MNRHIFQNSAFLKALYHAEPIQRKLMIEVITIDQIRTLCEITLKILQGRLDLSNLHRQKLKDYKRTLRSLVSTRINPLRKKKILLIFHKIIPLLIKPVLHLLNET